MVVFIDHTERENKPKSKSIFIYIYDETSDLLILYANSFTSIQFHSWISCEILEWKIITSQSETYIFERKKLAQSFPYCPTQSGDKLGLTGPLIYWYLTFHPVKNNSLHWKLWFSDMIAAGLRMSNISVTYLLFIFQRIISVLISVACVCHAVFSLAVVVQLISIQLLFLDPLDQLFSKQGPEAPRVLKEGCRRPPWEWGII